MINDPGRYSVEALVARFWWWRPEGRRYQTLKDDALIFLGSCLDPAGRDACNQAYRIIMGDQERDIADGGCPPDRYDGKSKKKRGLRVYR